MTDTFTITKTIEGYLLTNIEYKIITDFNELNNTNRNITCVPYGNKWILEKSIAEGVVKEDFWTSHKTMILSKIDKKTVQIYMVDFILPKIWG